MPRAWPRGLWERMAALAWQSEKAASPSLAAVVHQLRFRNVARIRKIAKSAAASEEATALGIVRRLGFTRVEGVRRKLCKENKDNQLE